MDRLQQTLERLRRTKSLAAILFLDLDRFNLVNDSLGHDVGNELLAATAPRLRQAVRSSDTVARFGGDEFGILLEEIAGEQDAIDMAQRIAAVFTRPFVLEGNEHFVTTSIGIALAQGGELAEDVVRDADAAMNRAKERGRARYELFDEGLRGRALSRLRVENDLRRALERDELTLDYQPLVSLRDFSIIGVEALIRWEHPERGRIPPIDFIPVAEENGLIEPIGRWVLENACRQAARWYRDRPDAPPLSMSVNLSAVQIANRGLAETVSAALRGSGLDPALLSLEITESVMLADADGLTEALSALKAIGVCLVLDDFGTGYSSLSYLTRLPLDVLKVDRSFIDGLGTEPRDTAITEAIVAMSHALSLRVVGEGAETGLQVSELNRLGCDYVQGFHFSRPVPALAITRMLETRARLAADDAVTQQPDARPELASTGHRPDCSGVGARLRPHRRDGGAAALDRTARHRDPQGGRVVGRIHPHTVSSRAAGAGAVAVRDPEPERGGRPRRQRDRGQRAGAEEIVGGAMGHGGQQGPALTAELDPRIAEGVARAGRGVADGKAQLPVAGGTLHAEKGQLEGRGTAHRRPRTGGGPGDRGAWRVAVWEWLERSGGRRRGSGAGAR